MNSKYEDLQRDNEDAFLSALTAAYKRESSKLLANYESKAYYGAKGIEAFKVDCNSVRNVVRNFNCPQDIVSFICCWTK